MLFEGAYFGASAARTKAAGGLCRPLLYLPDISFQPLVLSTRSTHRVATHFTLQVQVRVGHGL
jgi:hypothetical protein